MRKFVSVLLLSLSIITLIACTKNKQQSLDGEYYWISSERNEWAFTIKGNRGSIKHGEADSFINLSEISSDSGIGEKPLLSPCSLSDAPASADLPLFQSAGF